MAKPLIRKAALAAACAAATLPAPASARDYYYFNKPGVSREAYAADAAECAELAGGARASPASGPTYVSVPNTTAGMAGAAIGILFAGLLSSQLSSGETKRMKRSIERTCMADKGYVRMQVEKPVVDEIEKIKDEEARLDRMFALAASANPVGRWMKE